MMTKHQEMQRVIRWYKEETGEREVDMKKVAKFAVAHDWPLPEPVSPLDRLIREFSAAAREETREDKKTKRPYRVNHVYVDKNQVHMWIDIDEAPRGPMFESLQMRRNQMVGDAVLLTFDADHWNGINPDQPQIVMELDFGPDVDWRKNAGPDEDRKVG